MYSVGILSEQGKWSEVLSEMLKTTGSQVSGWVNPQESSPLITRQLIDFSDVIWIPEKMRSGMDDAIQVIRSSRHLSLGFPIDEFMDEAPFMVKLAHEARIQVQIGHYDWHNPAFRSSLSLINQPQTIRITESIPKLVPAESHHQIFKTILTDLDLAMGLSGSTVRKVRPHASRLHSGETIEVNVRVEMQNGSIISLNIRKFAPVPNRSIEIIQSNGIIEVDLLNGTCHFDEYTGSDNTFSVLRKVLWPPSGNSPVLIRPNRPGDQEMARQCLSFIHALNRGQHSLSGLEGGFIALELAQQIETILGSL